MMNHLRHLRRIGDALVFVVIPGLLIILLVMLGTWLSRREGMTGLMQSLSPLAGVASALLTYWYVAYTARMVRHMIETAREESRPFVVVDFEYEERIISVVVTNVGKAPAADVQIRFTPELQGSHNLSQTIFKKPIMFLPPGRVIRTVVDVSWLFFEGDNRLPTEYEVDVSYRRLTAAETYREHYQLDMSWFQHLTWVGKKNLDDMAKSLETLEKTFASVIDRDGVLVKTSADVRRQHRESGKRFKSIQRSPDKRK
jgi:hypothetical protein